MARRTTSKRNEEARHGLIDRGFRQVWEIGGNAGDHTRASYFCNGPTAVLLLEHANRDKNQWDGWDLFSPVTTDGRLDETWKAFDQLHQQNCNQQEQCERAARRPKVYEGIRDPNEPNAAGESIVLVNGDPLPLEPSLKIWNHSPTGFSWGYGGSGPAQLSLAILLDHFDGDAKRAQRYYQAFKFRVVAHWPQGEGWKITGAEIDAIIEAIDSANPQESRSA